MAARLALPLGVSVAVALLLGVGVAMIVGLSGWRVGDLGSGGVSGWSAVPLTAQGPVSAALGASQPEFRVRKTVAGGGLAAVNRGQGLHAEFTPAGVRVMSGGSWLGLRLLGAGFDGVLKPAGDIAPAGRGNRVTYAHRGIIESYVNGPFGLEQGLTVARPRRTGSGQLAVSLALTGDLHPVLAGGAVVFSRAGRPVLAYRDLIVSDAHGRRLPARLQLEHGRLQIRVDAAGAVYPLRVDPFVQAAELTASDSAAGDGLGSSVAVSGDGSTVVVGAPGHAVAGNSQQGAVYVFSDSAGAWTQTGELTASDGAADDDLGVSVAVSVNGLTVVAGAMDHAVAGNSERGAAYVFRYSGGAWSQSGELTASDGAAEDHLGFSVAVSGDGSTVIAGAPDHTVAGNTIQGAVYVFGDSGSGWAQTGELTASDGAAGDAFGRSVALSSDGSRVVAGAPAHAVGGNTRQGAAYVFGDGGGGWAETGELTASDGVAYDALGFAVALSGDGSTVVTGAPGHMVGGNTQQGAVYVFGDSGGSWSQAGELTASDGASYDYLGWSVAVAGDGSTVVAGAAHHAVGTHTDQGAVYVFGDSGGSWSQGGELTASDGATYDSLGDAVAVPQDGSVVIAGAPIHTVSGQYQGAAYVFTPSATTTSSSSSSSTTSTTATTTSTTATTTSTTATTTSTTTPTTAATTSTPTTTTTSPPPPRALPRVSSVRLSRIAGRNTGLSLTIGGHGSKLLSFAVYLPNGLRFTLRRTKQHALDQPLIASRAVASLVSLIGAKIKRMTMIAGKVTVTLTRSASSLKVKLSHLQISSTLSKKIRSKKVKKLSAKVTARAANGRTGTARYTVTV